MSAEVNVKHVIREKIHKKTTLVEDEKVIETLKEHLLSYGFASEVIRLSKHLSTSGQLDDNFFLFATINPITNLSNLLFHLMRFTSCLCFNGLPTKQFFFFARLQTIGCDTSIFATLKTTLLA